MVDSRSNDSPHRVGQPFDTDSPPATFELRLSDHLPSINPDDFKLDPATVEHIDPHSYFITSGDAIAKTKKLEHDLWKLAGRVKVQARTTKKRKYAQVVWQCAGRCASMLKKLIAVRGSFCFLETEWRNGGVLTVTPKNPRTPRRDLPNRSQLPIRI